MLCELACDSAKLQETSGNVLYAVAGGEAPPPGTNFHWLSTVLGESQATLRVITAPAGVWMTGLQKRTQCQQRVTVPAGV